MMNTSLTFAMAQIDTIVGNITANISTILTYAHRAADHHADVIVFPEMAITGYPIDDLVFHNDFRQQVSTAPQRLAQQLEDEGLGDLTVIVGCLEAEPTPDHDEEIWYTENHNSAYVISHGTINTIYQKHYLPTYGVFDELRLFAPGEQITTITIHGYRIGLAICEDLWREGGTVSQLAKENIDVLVSLNGSPYNEGKMTVRHHLLQDRAQEVNAPSIYLNQVGAQDNLVFDGGSFIIDPDGTILLQQPQFTEDLSYWTLTGHHSPATSSTPLASNTEQIYRACVLGLKDYMAKNHMTQVVLGLSGGIDSALVATMAVDALGAHNVYGIAMPSQISSEDSLTDATALAHNLGCHFSVEPIHTMVTSINNQLHVHGLAADNLQSRVRGLILMAYANEHHLVALDTTNKSELAVGYFTMYGDSVGGYAPISDVYKTRVYELARWRNNLTTSSITHPIPESTLTKPASAELHENQKDEDDLPPYPVLDSFLYQYIEQGKKAADIHLPELSETDKNHLIHMISAAEWKRRQLPQGPKVSTCALCKDRNIPISQQFI